jgi:hypothetical protein
VTTRICTGDECPMCADILELCRERPRTLTELAGLLECSADGVRYHVRRPGGVALVPPPPCQACGRAEWRLWTCSRCHGTGHEPREGARGRRPILWGAP